MTLEYQSEEQAPSGPNPRKRMLIMLLSVGLLMGLVVGFNVFKGIMIGRALAGGGEPPQVVTAAVAGLQDWQPELNAVGTVRARLGADLAFEVPGVVARIEVQPGSEVAQGQALITLNDDAEAAQLRQLQAQSALAESNLRRGKDQLAAKTISAADYEALQADFAGKQAGTQAMAALVAKKHLTAPFAGKVGIIATSPGAYVNPGTVLTTLAQLDRVYVDFALPQRNLDQIRKGQQVAASLDAFPGKRFPGVVTALNPRVDASTRNIQIEGTFANPQRLLVPGMFAAVTLNSGAPARQVTVPQTAVTYNPYGSVVFLVVKDGDKGLKAQQAFVTAGPTRGDQVAILKGLEPGAMVVTSGGLKLRNGTPVTVDNKVQPDFDPHPAPQEQ